MDRVLDDIVYEPLPAMDGEELRKLRAVIGLPEIDRNPIRPRVQVPPPSAIAGGTIIDDSNVIELRESVGSDGSLIEQMRSMHSELADLRRQVQLLQSTLELLGRRLLG